MGLYGCALPPILPPMEPAEGEGGVAFKDILQSRTTVVSTEAPVALKRYLFLASTTLFDLAFKLTPWCRW